MAEHDLQDKYEALLEENRKLREERSPTLAFLKKWLFTTDHKEVGILYFVTSIWFLLIGGILAVMMRTQLAFPSPWNFLSGAIYNQAVSMHGMIMVLFFLSPLGSAFANYFIPLQIGAKDVAFPRFNAFSYWMYLMAGIVLISGFFVPGGSAAAGWTNYAPLSSTIFLPGAGETLAGLGLLLLWGSLTMGTVNLLLTVFIMRAPGITWTKIPIFTWFMVFTLVLLLYSVPSILVGTLALVADRALGTVFFVNPAGSSVLWDHMWWFFAHPEVYVVVLPAFGAVAEVFQVFTGRPLYAKRALLFSIGFIMIPFSFSIYAHHMFLTGINDIEREFITLNTEVNSLPSGLIVICTLLTAAGGSVRLKAPLLFALGSISLFIIGGITGIFDSSVFLDQQLRGTYQVVSHFHYIMVGAAEFGLMAAVYYWLPKWSGRMYDGAIARVHFLFSFVFFNLTFLPMTWLLDMPRRIFTYLPSTGWGDFNFIESIGAFGFGIAQILLLYILVQAARGKGLPAPPNPWKASTPEWTGDSASYGSNYPAVFASDGPIHAGHSEHLTTPLNSRPFTIALGIGIAFIGVAYGWIVFLAGVVIAAYGLYGWAKDDLHGVFSMPFKESPGEVWPFSPDPDSTFGEWRIRMGVWMLLASDIVFFAAIVGSYLFIRENLPIWPSPGSVLDIPAATLGILILISSALTMVLAYSSVREGDNRRTIRWLVVTLILGGAFAELTATEWVSLFAKGFTFSSGLPGSTFYLITGIAGAHILVGLTVLVYLVKKSMSGGFGPKNTTAIRSFSIFWGFIVLASMALFPLVYLM
ncbi:MAG: cbb3-type cytochrome c oxidase subunit I [Thaumarchaeota archaeon]|nr:cbb3-type cytochrome c oxidase subunit I [Nitrososphaerota archaeon]